MHRSHRCSLRPKTARGPAAALVAAIVLTFQSSATAQCTPHWLPGGGLPGADQFVSAATTWDPDGNGPEPELLVIAGQFQVIGNQTIRGLAGWDGHTWREIDPDSQGDIYSISALAVYHGDLIVAGDFSTLSGVAVNDIARFDGHAWHPLGSGPENGITSTTGFGFVDTLRVVGDRVIAGGRFDLAGGVGAINIASWDGDTSAWEALGDGLSVGLFYEGVFGITEHEGEIIAAGDFTQSGATPVAGVARFDGTSWSGFAPVDSFFPFEVTTYGGELVAGGTFYDANNPDPFYVGDSIVVVWNGASQAWTQLGESLGSPGAFGVARLTEFHGELYAAGDFSDDIFDFDAPGMLLRRWDGLAWQPVGEGIGGFTGFQPAIAACTEYEGRLIVGGSFTHAGTVGAYDLAAWDGAIWNAFGSGTSGRITRFVEYGSGIVASGWFDTIEGTPAHRLARWDGVSWQPIGDGTLGSPRPLGVFEGQLVVSAFTPDGRLRRWDGSAWQPFAEAIPEGFVSSMALYHDRLIIGGSFTFTGYYGEQINNVAAWDGQHWRGLGQGVIGQFFGAVNAMKVYQGKLIVAGAIQAAGGEPASGIASWNGATWKPLGLGLTSSNPPVQIVVNALAIYRGELIATGQFGIAGLVPARNIARWNGAKWSALGPDGATTLGGPGSSLASSNGVLYVGGQFGYAGGVEVHNIARWNGNAWSALEGGVDPLGFGSVDTMMAFQGRLLVGGSFVYTGTEVSAFLARWGCD